MVRVAAFREQLASRWQALRSDRLSNESIFSLIDGYQDLLTESVIDENFAIWPIENVDFNHIYSAFTIYEIGSYEEEVAFFRSWISDRLEWMDANIGQYPEE
jgi:hypothetical protein